METTIATEVTTQNQHGLWHWLLKEAVRANPLYVISAAFLAYALQQLMVEVDPQIGKLGGVIASLIMLHVYEIAVLAVATVVLKRRARGGLDMHGLLIVGGLYMGVTFIALDEWVSIQPRMGLAIAVAGLMLAAIKLAWYARLPGVLLPFRYRAVALAVLSAHELSPFLNSRELSSALPSIEAQGWAWFAGWVSLLPILWLICVETSVDAATSSNENPTRNDVATANDPLASRLCGSWLVCIAALAGIIHLYVSDWIFDQPADYARIFSSVMIISASIVLLRWRNYRSFGFFEYLLVAAPFLIVEELWRALTNDAIQWQWTFLLNPAMQSRIASVVFYCALAWGTGRTYFYAGLSAPVGIPFVIHALKSRGTIPHFRALAAAFMGFATLGMGMLLSLFRERLIRRLDSKK